MSVSGTAGPDGAEQILIRWSERTMTGGSGVGPVAASLRDPAELARWEHRLLGGDWAAAEATSEPDQPALVYLRFGEEAAVLRREVVRDPRGRGGSPNTHVLVGRAELLSPNLALGLHDWAGWIDNDASPAELGWLDGDRLRYAADDGYQVLRGRSRAVAPQVLGALIATVLSAPTSRISAYQPGDAAGTAGAVPATELLCGLLDLLGPAIARDWTFSTAETGEPASENRPALVFLTRSPQFSTRGQTGYRVRIGEAAWLESPPGTSAEMSDLAAFGVALADAYSSADPADLARIDPRKPVVSARDALDWAAEVQLVPGVLNDVGILLYEIGLGRVPAAEAAAEERPLEYFADGLAKLPGDAFRTLANYWFPEAHASGRHPRLGETIRATAASRYLAGGDVAEDGRDSGLDRAVIIALGVPGATWLAQLGQYLGVGDPADRQAVIGRAVELLPSAQDQDLARTLSALPFTELLGLAALYAEQRPSLSEALLRQAAVSGSVTAADRLAIWHWLTPPALLARLAERRYAASAAAGAQFAATVLRGALGASLEQPNTIAMLVDKAGAADSAVLLWAVAGIVPPDQRQRILSLAGTRWFESRGLDWISAFGAPAASAAPQRPGAVNPGQPAMEAAPQLAHGTSPTAQESVRPGPADGRPDGRKAWRRWWRHDREGGRRRIGGSRIDLAGVVFIVAAVIAVVLVIGAVLVLLGEPL